MTKDENGQEGFRFGALITGPLNWKNHLKAAVFLAVIFIWLCIGWGVWSAIKHFKGGTPPPTPDVITAETANVDKSQKIVNNHYYTLLDLLGFNKGKVQDLSNNDKKDE